MKPLLIVFLTLSLCTSAPAAGPDVRLDRPRPELRTGADLRRELNQTLLASWDGMSLRHVLRRITTMRGVAVLLDRRIDPTREMQINLGNQTLREGLRRIARRVSARLSLVGNVVYIGPPDGAAKIRTLVQLRSNELFEMSSELPKGRHFELGESWTLHWNDLDRPSDLVERIAERYQLTVDGLEQIPHDLWAGGTLPDVNAWEALSLVLIQFDKTFVWTGGAAGIRIVPVPDDVWIEKTYEPRGLTADKAVAECKERIPELVHASVRGDRVLVRGTVEQHERIESLLRPGSRRRDRRRPDTPVPVSRRRFTLTVKRVPVRALMQKLAMSGIVFEYDAQRLQAAGVDLEQRIDMDLTQAKPEEFFRAMFEPLGLEFAIDGATVTLTPKDR